MGQTMDNAPQSAGCSDRVTYNEPVVHGVVKELHERGYKAANGNGFVWPEIESYDIIGVIRPREPIERRKFFGLIRTSESQPGIYLGNLWFNNPNKGAEERSAWVFDIFGKENLEEAIELSERISEPFNVKVVVKLTRDAVEYQRTCFVCGMGGNFYYE